MPKIYMTALENISTGDRVEIDAETGMLRKARPISVQPPNSRTENICIPRLGDKPGCENHQHIVQIFTPCKDDNCTKFHVVDGTTKEHVTSPKE